ncbi:MAG: hypoxanthine phosphoribosyltransferase [Anaerolineae bacterium]|nr:MAG: hypoxanthine phosphoribosyltransferase [Anaerolineae bacterium]
MTQYPVPEAWASAVSQVLFTPEQIQQRVTELGQQITRDYADTIPVMIGVLKGIVFFMADLVRAINIPVEVDFMSVSNYSADARDRGLVRLVKDLEMPIEGRHVIFVEDIIDTGLTIHYLLRTLQARQPASLEVCVLFNKDKRRLIELPLRYKGFDIPDYYVVGYGLDYREKYRNLPFVGLLKAEALHNG